METLSQRARGRWHGILPAIGIGEKFLKRKNGPCPMCGGKDRWRFTDIDGKGTWWCNHCRGGSGVDLVMRFTGLPFPQAAVRIESLIGGIPRTTARAKSSAADIRDLRNRLWSSGQSVRADDPVDRWFKARGVGRQNYPSCLRTALRIRYAGPLASYHTAMLAMVSDASGRPGSIHKTYLTADGSKAAVDKARMFAPGAVPTGGAVRLAPPATILGIAEGIETALAASRMFGIPTWAGLNDGGIERFEPPIETKRLIIFGDNDRNCVGQRAAYALAARLAGKLEVEVRIPDAPGTDWNDVIRERDAG